MATSEHLQASKAAQSPEASFGTGYLQWKSWEPGEFGRFSALDASYYTAEFGICRPMPQVPPAGGLHAVAGARVLEIGFGNGAVLAWLRASGAEAYGVEANPLLVERAIQLLGPGRAFSDLQDTALLGLAGTFTQIIALDVLEHVPLESLPAMLSSIRNLLAPGASAVLRFPNGDSPFGRMYQHGDPTHVTTLGSIRVTYFAHRAGLEVTSIRSPALPVRNVGFSRGLRRFFIRGGRQMIEYVVGQLYFGGRSLPLNPNYTAVLTRPAV